MAYGKSMKHHGGHSSTTRKKIRKSMRKPYRGKLAVLPRARKMRPVLAPSG